jgi:pimeloyl-ACP methyl ester carboxylesterase
LALSWAFRHRASLLLAVLVLPVAAACADDRPPPAQPVEGAPATAVATQTDDVAAAIATPRMLPVTPVSIDYTVVDPAFDAVAGARAVWGQYEGGGYQIEVPDDWNGDVVYFAHGFRGNPPQLTVSFPPIREYLIENGYAWAASSYSKNGYEPGAGARDTYALRTVFSAEVGQPVREYIYGHSMGGHVVAFSLEEYPDAYDGAISECGVVSGHEILDFFLSWGVLAGYFTDTDLADASGDAGALGVLFKDRVVPALGGVDELTPAGRAFADTIMHLSGGPRPYFFEGFAANYNFNFVILVNAVATAGPSNAAADNVSTRYVIGEGHGVTSDELNREVPRVAANSLYRDASQYPEFADPTGAIEVPLLTLHNTGDLFVPISLEQSYRRIVDAAGSGDLLVQRAIRREGHCNFSDQERIRAFDDLVAWVERGEKPAGDDLLGDLREAGRAFTDPPEDDDPGRMTP